MKAKNAHIFEREAHEHYVEPEWTSRRLFEVERFDGPIWDPCCGFGRIPEAARAAGHFIRASDIVDRGYDPHPDMPGGTKVVKDFFDCALGCKNIVCNPPFDIFEKFVVHALAMSTHKVAMIWLVPRLNAARWLQGTPLARIYLLTPRPSMPPGYTITAGQKPGGGTQDFCWLVWDRAHSGPPSMHWLHRNKPYDARDDSIKSYEVGLEAIRQRVAAGGETWKPE